MHAQRDTDTDRHCYDDVGETFFQEKFPFEMKKQPCLIDWYIYPIQIIDPSQIITWTIERQKGKILFLLLRPMFSTVGWMGWLMGKFI